MTTVNPSGPSSPHDLAPLYAIDALDDAEREAFARHLEACPACQAEVRELEETAGLLAVATHRAPPPSLRADVLSAIADIPQDEAAETPAPVAPPVSLESRRRRRLGPVLAAVAAVVA